ncbi:MAG: DUF4352 domain-containing protein [Actinobacteria bacterium]|nr:DUF4352 domain-containing protein [Actinomycetota bacterium]
MAGLVLGGLGATGVASAEPVPVRFERPCAKTGTYVKPNGEPGRNTTRANPGLLFVDRADQRDEDQERQLGQTANLGGYTVTVTAAEFVPSLSDDEQAGYLKVAVKVCNRNGEAQDVNPFFDWKLQTPSGTLIDPAITSAATLPAVGLVQDGEVAGDLYFAVGEQRGDFYAIYQPASKLFDESRGLWKLTI